MLRDYYDHLTDINVDSMISRIYGLHKVIFYRKKHKMAKKLYFCIMNNVFCTPNKIDYRYDLKGSTAGRTTKFEEGKPRDNTIALKDLDFIQSSEKLKVGKENKAKLNDIIKLDAAFFAKIGVIDYSLLVGVHKKQQVEKQVQKTDEVHQNIHRSESSMSLSTVDLAVLQLGKKKFYEKNEGGLLSTDGKKIYYMGIIDIFTDYTALKKAEYVIKSL